MTSTNDVDLRLRDFRVLSVVLRELSLTRAAEALETTQPSVSKVLARLRTHFDDPLFWPCIQQLRLWRYRSRFMVCFLLRTHWRNPHGASILVPLTAIQNIDGRCGYGSGFSVTNLRFIPQGPQLSSWGPCLG